MKKSQRYLLATFVCVVIFALWVVCQMFIAKGIIVAIIFCVVIWKAWKAITKGDDDKELV